MVRVEVDSQLRVGVEVVDATFFPEGISSSIGIFIREQSESCEDENGFHGSEY